MENTIEVHKAEKKEEKGKNPTQGSNESDWKAKETITPS